LDFEIFSAFSYFFKKLFIDFFWNLFSITFPLELAFYKISYFSYISDLFIFYAIGLQLIFFIYFLTYFFTLL
jgi:hypothetical protein